MIFRDYKSEVEITPLVADNAYHTFDLAPLLQSTAARAVCLRCARGAAGTWSVEVKGTHVDEVSAYSKVAKACFETVVSLNGGTTIKYRISLGSNVVIFITGEVHGPAVIHPATLLMNLTEPAGGWEDPMLMQPTPINGDALEDIQAVIIKTLCVEDGTKFVATHTDELLYGDPGDPLSLAWHEGQWLHGQHWWVVGLDDNYQYVIATSGKAGFDNEYCYFSEVGYIKRPSGVVTVNVPWLYADLMWAGTDDWETVNLSEEEAVEDQAYVESAPAIAGIFWLNALANQSRAFVRALGGADMSRKIVHKNSTLTQMVALDRNLECEYTLKLADVWAALHWYEVPELYGATIRRLGEDELLGASLSSEELMSLYFRAEVAEDYVPLPYEPVGTRRRGARGFPRGRRAEGTSASLARKDAVGIRTLNSDDLLEAKLRRSDV